MACALLRVYADSPYQSMNPLLGSAFWRSPFRPLDAQSERDVSGLYGLDDAHDRRGLILRDRAIAIHHEPRGVGIGQGGAAGPQDTAAVLDPQRKVREVQLQREFDAGVGAAQAAQLGRAAHE